LYRYATGFGQEDLYVEAQCKRDLSLLFASRVIDFAVIMFAIRDTVGLCTLNQVDP
jgi:hypothetical protein